MMALEFRPQRIIDRTSHPDVVMQSSPNEPSSQLHERLRRFVVDNTQAVDVPTELRMLANRTLDVSSITGVKNSVAVFTSGCVHEYNLVGKHPAPFLTFVGIRAPGTWNTTYERCDVGSVNVFRLIQLGATLSDEMKNQIYDSSQIGYNQAEERRLEAVRGR